jgi:glycosyltransferase 2 family protein
MMRRWSIRALVSLIVAAILLTVVPISAVMTAIKRINIETWLASLVIFFTGHYFNAVKLRILVGQSFVPLSACVRAQYAGLVANLSLPGLAGGDLVRAAYLVPVAGAKRIALASVADRILDSLTLLVLVAVAIPIAGMPSAIADQLPGGRAWMIVGLGGAAAAIAGAAAWRHPAVSSRVGPLLGEFRGRWIEFMTAVAISFSVQASFVLTNAWLARDVGVTTGLAAWFVAWPLSKLIAVLPVSLGGIGVREAALVTLLAPYGAPRDAVLASGFLWQTVLIVSGLAGLIVTQWLWQPAATEPATALKGHE